MLIFAANDGHEQSMKTNSVRIDELLEQRRMIDSELAEIKAKMDECISEAQEKIAALNAVLSPFDKARFVELSKPKLSQPAPAPTEVERPGDFDNGEGEPDSHDIRDELRALREMSLEKRRRRG